MRVKRFVGAVCLLAGLAVPCCGWAQAPVPAAEQAELTRTVAELDAKLFDAYNHCDLKTLGAMVSDDLEFYHDQTGLMVGKAPFLAAIQNNICGKVERTLVPGSLEVYRLKGYGAVEIGVHRFRHPGDEKELGGEAKFVQLWQNKDGVWKLTRVISYDHESRTK
jgi:ketosteroid isomerase-like protein